MINKNNMNLKEFNEWIETYKYDDDGKFTIYISTMDLHKLCEDYHKEQLALYNVSFPLFQDLYGSYVQMNDRFETVHIWNRELAMKNKGRWTPMLISKKIYDQEKQELWNN